ncbi:MAG: polyphosphate kinase 1 [Deferribacteraceae bacterium]|jgi:polyphosphate kinase|nr:polyphosphate kinase 1 [Deferribacteraceae bacterium]
MSKIINRELSWLRFNERVLAEATDKRNPLLERLRFLAIFASNLDEFFMVRVSGLREQIDAGYNTPDPSGYVPTELLAAIMKLTSELTDFEERVFSELKTDLLGAGIFFPDLSEEIFSDTLETIFLDEIMPVITPVTIDPSHPFPFIYSRRLCIVAQTERKGKVYTSLIMIPETLRRVFRLKIGQSVYIFTVEDIIMKYLHILLKGYTVKAAGLFRVTRDADLDVAEEESADLLRSVEHLLSERKRGDVNRVEISGDISEQALELLSEKVDFELSDVQRVKSKIDLTFLFSLCDLKKELLFPPLAQRAIRRKPPESSGLFDIIKEKPLYFFRPYNSFSIVSELIAAAAVDEDVLAIKMTLYRTNTNSTIINSLLEAARRGKQVSVVVELKARFDEERNIGWAKNLEKAGCIVTYGIVGLKIHAKCLLIVRTEDEKIVRYTHAATGNYNEITANIYTDIDYITADEDIGRDATQLFNYLMGFTEENIWRVMKVAPFTLKDAVLEMIDREISFAKKGLDAEIIIKVNSITDLDIIEKLYLASSEGVNIHLIVRGICALRPQVKGLSENITVISIVGRFLEHARVLYFQHGGVPRYFITSADLMPRNLIGRVELMVEARDEDFKRSLNHFLRISLQDSAWSLTDERYSKPEERNGLISQHYFMINEI